MNNEQMNINEPKERAEQKLEFFIENCEIYIDTCSLLHFASIEFFDNAETFLTNHSKQIFVLSGGIKELVKHSMNTEDSNLASNAKKTLKIIEMFKQNNLISIIEKDGFVDNAFLTLFTNLRMGCYPLLITQDKDLAKDILDLNNTRSVKANKVRVAKINQYGFLSEFAFLEDDSESNKKEREEHAERSKEIIVYPTDERLLRREHWYIKDDLLNATEDEFLNYCQNFLSEKIYEVIPQESDMKYRHVAQLINCLTLEMFRNLNIKTNRILLVVKINSLFKAVNTSINENILHIAIESLATKRYGQAVDLSVLELDEDKRKEKFDLNMGVQAEDLNSDTYVCYSRLYFIEKIYEIIPKDSRVEYRHVSNLINCISSTLYQGLHTEMGKVTIVNKISSLFMQIDEALPKDYLLELAEIIADKEKNMH